MSSNMPGGRRLAKCRETIRAQREGKNNSAIEVREEKLQLSLSGIRDVVVNIPVLVNSSMSFPMATCGQDLDFTLNSLATLLDIGSTLTQWARCYSLNHKYHFLLHCFCLKHYEGVLGWLAKTT